MIDLGLVKKFAPVIRFHPDERYYPCAIEDILRSSTLKAEPAMQIADVYIDGDNGNKSQQPAYVQFKGKLYMAYSTTSRQINLCTSKDGFYEWSAPAHLCDGQSPTLTVHKEQLWMAYQYDTRIHVTCMDENGNWRGSWQIPDQATFYPVMVSYAHKLWIVYTDVHSSQAYMTNSGDGHDWEVWQIPHWTDIPAMTVFKDKLYLVYTGSDSGTIYCASSTDGHGWSPVVPIPDQKTSVPAIAAFQGKLWMVYSEDHSSHMHVSWSENGTNWEHTNIPRQYTSIPALASSEEKLFMVYPDSDVHGAGAHWRQMWASFSVNGKDWQPADIDRPTQQDMQERCGGRYYLDIREDAFAGNVDKSPMYFSVQQSELFTDISYIILFAYNGSQTTMVGSDDCILRNFARHQGDIERVTARISSGEDPKLLSITTESHGDSKTWTPDQLKWDGHRYIVYSSLNAHGTFNMVDNQTWISKEDVGVADFGDAIGDGRIWSPADYRLVGLDREGGPINQEVWVKFSGRIGAHSSNSLTAGTDFAGANLSAYLWAWIKTCAGLADGFGLMPADATSGDGPKGLATRPYVQYVEPVPPRARATTPCMTADGRVEVFSLGTDSAVYSKWQTSPHSLQWSDWASVGGFVAGKPVPCRNSDGRMEVFVRGTDNAVWHRWQTAGSSGVWSEWASLYGIISGDPVVVANTDGRLELFARGTDNAVYHKWQTTPHSAEWSGWDGLGGDIASDPVAIGNSDGRLELFARGSNEGLWHISQKNPHAGPWSAWTRLGDGVISRDLGVIRNADGRLEVFARGTDNGVWHMGQTVANSDTWSDWSSLGGVISGQPSAAVNTDGRVEVFARGTDNALWCKWQTRAGGPWSGWASLGGTTIDSDPAAINNSDGRLEVFARGSDRALWHIWQTRPGAGPWSKWSSLGGVL
jgi:acylphosphatase